MTIYDRRTTPVFRRKNSNLATPLLTPRYYLSTYGRRAFSYAGPSAWNSLPEHLRAPDLTLALGTR